MTSVRRKDDLNVDLEQQFVLRMPPRAADNLLRDLDEGLLSSKDKLTLEIHPEKRRGKVIYDGQMYHAKLVDLPCIIESYKSIDKKNFHKSADISQMLVCKDEFGTESPEEGEDGVKKRDKEKKCMWNHGLCAPLKNVRKRRFRKTLQKKNPELPDIERELRRLFTMDAQATSFKYEVIYDSDNNSGNNTKNTSNSTSNSASKKNTHSTSNTSNRTNATTQAVIDKTEQTPQVRTAEDLNEESMEMEGVGEKNYNPLEIFGYCSSSEDERSDTDRRLAEGKKGEGSKGVNQSALDDDDDDENSRTAIVDDDDG